MKNIIKVILLSLVSCIFLQTALYAVIITQIAKEQSGLNEIQIKGAEKIAQAILHKNTAEATTTYDDSFATDLLMYQDIEEALNLARNLTSTVTTNLVNMGDKTLRSLSNQAGQTFMSLQDRHINRLLMAKARLEHGTNDLIDYWTIKQIASKTLIGHSHKIDALEFSPHGNYLASGSWDKTIRLWEGNTGRCLGTLSVTGPVNTLAFSSDSKTLAYSMFHHHFQQYPKHEIYLWNFSGTGTIAILKGHTDLVGGIAFSPDGKFLASSSFDKTVRVWNLENHNIILQQHAAGGPIAIAFSRDSTRLSYFLSPFTVQSISPETGQIINEINIGYPAGGNNYIEFSPDGNLIAIAHENSPISLWNLDENRKVAELPNRPGSSPWTLSFSPDSKLLVAGYRVGSMQDDKSSVILWDVQTATEIRQLSQENTKVPITITFSPDSKTIAIGYHDGTLKMIWATEPAQQTTMKEKPVSMEDID